MNNELYTKKFNTGKKTYYFDVKENNSRIKYVQVSEIRHTPSGERIRNEITIFHDKLDEFLKELQDVKTRIENSDWEERN